MTGRTCTSIPLRQHGCGGDSKIDDKQRQFQNYNLCYNLCDLILPFHLIHTLAGGNPASFRLPAAGSPDPEALIQVAAEGHPSRSITPSMRARTIG